MGKVALRRAACTSMLALAACGGGGGGVGGTPTPPPVTTPTPAPTPAPAPAPTPSPTPVANPDTAEYRATVGAVSMNALAAYNTGASGAGIGIGIIDTGLDIGSEEFGGRISAASRDVAGNRTTDDESGHGTAVAFTAAGRRNGVGTHGVAPDATVIVLRADTPGSCAQASTDDADDGCTINTDAIGRGVDAARLAGARVINLSIGGAAMPRDLMAAIGRATAAGIVVVIAAGNDGTPDPDDFAQVANNAAIARNRVIVAGSVDANNARTPGADTLSKFGKGSSAAAGNTAAHYLAAVGANVRAPCNNSSVCLWSGTSLSTPQIAGAVALLAQAFPNLSGGQIVDLLFRTARDAGSPGVDATYGNGVLDLTRAFQPVGTMVVAGNTTGMSSTSNAGLSAPMGDARQAPLGAVVLDSYDRAFAMDLAGTVEHAAPLRTLTGALQSRTRTLAAAGGDTAIAMTLVRRPNGDAVLQRSSLTAGERQAARAIAGSVTRRFGPALGIGFAFAQGSDGITAALAGRDQPAFLVARADGMGFDNRARAATALRQRVAGFGVGAGIEAGDVLTRRTPLIASLGGLSRSPYARATVTLDRRFGGLAATLSAEHLREERTLLGAEFDPGLGAARGTSWFLGADARWAMGDGWTLGGSLRRGWSRATLNRLTGAGRLATGAFAADLGKDGVFGSDSLGLRIAQPLRVARGGLDIALPTGWDYADRSVSVFTMQRLNLAPDGRELDVEARYAWRWSDAQLDANLFWRRDPGNIAALPADLGLALRLSRGF